VLSLGATTDSRVAWSTRHHADEPALRVLQGPAREEPQQVRRVRAVQPRDVVRIKSHRFGPTYARDLKL
jgi:hypothetical protein